jgi:hypothetical protein
MPQVPVMPQVPDGQLAWLGCAAAGQAARYFSQG